MWGGTGPDQSMELGRAEPPPEYWRCSGRSTAPIQKGYRRAEGNGQVQTQAGPPEVLLQRGLDFAIRALLYEQPDIPICRQPISVRPEAEPAARFRSAQSQLVPIPGMGFLFCRLALIELIQKGPRKGLHRFPLTKEEYIVLLDLV